VNGECRIDDEIAREAKEEVRYTLDESQTRSWPDTEEYKVPDALEQVLILNSLKVTPKDEVHEGSLKPNSQCSLLPPQVLIHSQAQ
jgi:hypothetical protein